jgi:Big-like domain-containing protein
MVLWPLRTILFAFATASVCVPASLAQNANYASVTTIPDKPVQLSYHASAHKSNCSPGAAPTVRVIEAPKSGMLAVREAELTTDKIAGCPALKTPAQVVFYTANTDYSGPDHVKYEVKDENGELATYDMTIAVKAAEPGQNPPAQNPPAGITGSQPQ